MFERRKTIGSDHPRGVLFTIAVLVGIGLGDDSPAQIWQQVSTPTAPTSRGAHSMAYDSHREVVVLFGGNASSASCSPNDTWEWDGMAWNPAVHSVAPPARSYSSMAYDPVRREVLLFGGWNCSGQALDDTWTWDGISWVQRQPAARPPARFGGKLFFDDTLSAIVLFGGTTRTTHGGGTLSDTWMWDGLDWRPLQPALSPPSRAYFSLTYDPGRRRAVLFGGWNNLFGSPSFADTWEWDGTSWTEMHPPTTPGRRNGVESVYDVTRMRTILHGGDDACVNAYTTTWDWDGSTWRPWIPNAAPGYRLVHGMAYHAGQRQVVLFGGLPATCASNAPYGDTWLISSGQSGSYLPFGTGCGVPAPRLAGDALVRPSPGSIARIDALDVGSASQVVFYLGSSRRFFAGVPLPLALDSLGLTGCSLWSEPIWPVAVNAVGGTARMAGAIPNEPALIATAVYFQALVPSPGANGAGLITSSALEMRVGF